MNAGPIIDYVESLISEGEELAKETFTPSGYLHPDLYVDLQGYYRWKGNCKILQVKLGSAFEPWKGYISGNAPNTLNSVLILLGGLNSVKDALRGDHLVRYTNLVFAEAFANLLDQAEHLYASGYFLAAGILGRAVLEEELRRKALASGCFPQKPRPTLNDLNTELFKAQIYDKVEFKLIESLTAIGNECAHNKPGATTQRVDFLLQQLIALLTRISQ